MCVCVCLYLYPCVQICRSVCVRVFTCVTGNFAATSYRFVTFLVETWCYAVRYIYCFVFVSLSWSSHVVDQSDASTVMNFVFVFCSILEYSLWQWDCVNKHGLCTVSLNLSIGVQYRTLYQSQSPCGVNICLHADKLNRGNIKVSRLLHRGSNKCNINTTYSHAESHLACTRYDVDCFLVIRMLIVYHELAHLNVRRYHFGSWSMHTVCNVKVRLWTTAHRTINLKYCRQISQRFLICHCR